MKKGFLSPGSHTIYQYVLWCCLQMEQKPWALSALRKPIA